MLSHLVSVKTHLGVPLANTASDAQLSQWLAEADAAVKEYTHQKIEAGTYTEFYSAWGSEAIRLRQRWVTSVASVYFDPEGNWGQTAGSFGSATLLAAGVDYALEIDQPDGVTSRSGLLYRLGGAWPAGIVRRRGLLAAGMGKAKGPIRVTYSAGFAAIPADLELAENLAVAYIRLVRKGALLTSESYEQYSYSLTPPEKGGVLPQETLDILGRYYPRIWLYGV